MVERAQPSRRSAADDEEKTLTTVRVTNNSKANRVIFDSNGKPHTIPGNGGARTLSVHQGGLQQLQDICDARKSQVSMQEVDAEPDDDDTVKRREASQRPKPETKASKAAEAKQKRADAKAGEGAKDDE